MNNENKNYPQTKVYFDGSQYIGIPKDNFPHGKSCKRMIKLDLFYRIQNFGCWWYKMHRPSWSDNKSRQ